jgi:hypothetical protein
MADSCLASSAVGATGLDAGTKPWTDKRRARRLTSLDNMGNGQYDSYSNNYSNSNSSSNGKK